MNVNSRKLVSSIGCYAKNSLNNWAIIRGIRHRCLQGPRTLTVASCQCQQQQGCHRLFSTGDTSGRSSDPEAENINDRTTVAQDEVDKFSRISETWWQEAGEFQALHSLNELRVPLIRDGLLEPYGERSGSALPSPRVPRPLAGHRILDVGCGGGILSEPLARLGADVTGIDASEENIAMAEWHRGLDVGPADRLSYLACPVEDVASQHGPVYDGVVASEIMEHVTNPQAFIGACCGLVKPGGSLFITTLNKTWLSYSLAVVAAERLLRIVPEGAHDWNKFVDPETLQGWLGQNGFHTVLCHGMALNPLSNRWSWISNTSVNYAVHAVKIEDSVT